MSHSIPLASTQLEETPQSIFKPTCINVDVVDDTMWDLDPFSPAPKALVLCPQLLVVWEVPDFPDSSQVPADNTFDDRDSDPNEPELNFDLHEGLTGKAVNEEVIDLDPVPQRKKEKKHTWKGNWKRKRKRNPPLDPPYFFKQFDKLRRSFTRCMLVASFLLIILKKKMSQMSTSEDGNIAFFVQTNMDATNCISLVLQNSVVDSRAKGI